MGAYQLAALHVNPPQQQADPTEQYTRLMALKQQQQDAPLRQQALQQQVQSGQLDIQSKQLEMKDQQAMQAAVQQWGKPKAAPSDGAPAPAASATPQSGTASMPSYEDLYDLAKTNGASYKTLQGIQKTILDTKEKAAAIAKDDAQTGLDNAGALIKKNGAIVDALTGVINAPDNELVPRLTQTAQQLQQQGLLDPQHIQLAQQLVQSGDPAAIRQQLDFYAKSLGGYSKIQEQAKKDLELQQEKGKTDPNAPNYAPSEQAVAAGTAPLAAQIKAGKVAQGAAQAGADERARLPGEMALAKQRQALSQGDPAAAGHLLVTGEATLSELKARGSTPEFIAKTLYAASKESSGKYNAQAADAQFAVAKSPTQVQFFGSAKSLTDKGGTLDQLAETAKNIPQHQMPIFNSLDDWTKAAAGSGPLAEYAARVLGVADDYAKVMGGGTGSDASRLSAANLISAKLSKEGRDGAISGIRGSVGSQIKSRIGKNPTLLRMYGDDFPDAASGGSATPASSDPFAQFGGKAH